MEEKDSRETILVVDDDRANLMLAQKILGKDYRIAAANSGEAALRYLEKNTPHLILMDINMPEMDGFETVERLAQNEKNKNVPIIFLTASNDAQTEMMCFRAGAVDFVGKPFIPDILISRVNRTLELERYRRNLESVVKEQTRELKEKAERISEIQESVIVGMADIIESRDDSTGQHVKNTQKYVGMIIDKLYNDGMFEQLEDAQYRRNIFRAACLHDVGKIRIPDNILQKPGKLTDEEYEKMKLHTVYGRQIVMDIIGDVEDEDYTKIAADIAGYHHERWDGKGYPEGLAGDDIPLCARIMAVADVFDALYAERCYKKPIRPIEKVFEIIEEGRGTQFDAVVVDAFLGMKDELKLILGEN